MTTNKTPIQELIDLVSKENATIDKWELMVWLNEDGLEKEKAFAFDCYKSGLESWTWDVTEGICEVGSPTFEGFYYKYAEQHPK